MLERIGSFIKTKIVMNKYTVLFFTIIIVGIFSCKPTPVVVDKNPWNEVPNLSLNSTINKLYATDTELLIGSIDNFARMNANQTVTERRELEIARNVYGRPILSDNVFARVVKNLDFKQELQLHLVKSSNQIHRVTADEMGDSSEIILLEEMPNAFNTGAFSDDGSKFLYVTRNFNATSSHYTFFVFDIQLNPSKTQFVNVTISGRADIPVSLLGVEADRITNVRYIKDHFYVTTLGGAFRVSEAGEWVQIFSHWIWDVFYYNTDLYTTGFFANEFFKSFDNGENWEYANTDTNLKKVEVKNGLVFTQDNLGLPYKLANEELSDGQLIDYNENFFDDEPTAYQAVEFFNGDYYVSVHKRLYFLDEIKLK